MAAPIALVTGANQGVGRSIAEILARQHGFHSIIGARNLEQGEEVAANLRAEGHKATFVPLDLQSQQSVEAAVATIDREFGRLDVLVNNAAVLLDQNKPPLNKWDLFYTTQVTNVVGPAALTEGLLPLLRKSEVKPVRVVFVSSAMGSLALTQDKTTGWHDVDFTAYDASKAGVNVMALNYSQQLESIGAKVNVCCPGYVGSRMNKYDPNGKTTDEGARRAVELATLGPDGPTGTFSNTEGPLPW